MDAQERRFSMDAQADVLVRFLHFHQPWRSYVAGAWMRRSDECLIHRVLATHSLQQHFIAIQFRAKIAVFDRTKVSPS